MINLNLQNHLTSTIYDYCFKFFAPFSCRIGFRPTLASCAVDKEHKGGESKPEDRITRVPYRPNGTH